MEDNDPTEGVTTPVPGGKGPYTVRSENGWYLLWLIEYVTGLIHEIDASSSAARLADALEITTLADNERDTPHGVKSARNRLIRMKLLNLERFADFHLIMSLSHLAKDDLQLALYILATVESKAVSRFDKNGDDVPIKAWDAEMHMLMSLPQVIMQVQIALVQYPKQKQIAAVQFLNDWCRILFFRRDDVPALETGNLHPDGYWPRGTSRKSSARSRTKACSQMLDFAHFVTKATPMFAPAPDVASFTTDFKNTWDLLMSWSRVTSEGYFPCPPPPPT